MRYAYLIMAHNEFGILRQLVSLLDDESNDIFIHFDRKVKKIPDGIKTRQSGLFIIDERIDVRWGCMSQIEAEFALLRAAFKNDEYSHYFIISGTHLPLKNINYINTFIGEHLGESVFKLWDEDIGNINFKFGKYHLFTKGCYSNNKFIAFISNFAWRFALKIQTILKITRKIDNLIKADQWCLLSEEAVIRLLNEEKNILSKYRYTFCPDEYVMATELKQWELPCFDCQNLLYTKFEGSRPISFCLSNLNSLKSTDYLFARKFTSQQIL